jgi:putative tryptophan/tyrosine transport system substrate-binding protein
MLQWLTLIVEAIMRRREFIALVWVAASWAFASDARQRTSRIGFFTPQSPDPSWIEAFRAGMREHGYWEGRNLIIALRSADGEKERYRQLIEELLDLKPDVLMTWSTPTSMALKQATSAIPIVSISGDPVGLGLAASLAHPQGNLTGFAILSVGIETKQLQILKDINPNLARVAVLTNPTNAVNATIVSSIQKVGSSAGITIQTLQVENANELTKAFEAAATEQSNAVLVLRDDLFDLNRQKIGTLAAKMKLLTMTGWSEYAHAGCLVAYGVNFSDLFRRAASYVDKILKGSVPGDLPIARPEKFELVVNLKVARELGLTIPTPVLVEADEVIE